MLKKGDIAPPFQLPSNLDKEVSLNDYKGKWLVLYFYPKDSTPGCTLQAIDFSNAYTEFQQLGVDIIGINGDNIESHQKFVCKNKLPFLLLSDTGKSVLSSYKVWGEKNFMGVTYEGLTRSTFIINPEGIIEEAMYNIKAKNHSFRILRTLKQLVGDNS